AITFRGKTDVEKGFEDYFASRKVPVQITYRDMNRDSSRMPRFIQEIRTTRPDLIYTWGTTVTLGVVGPFDAADQGEYITDIPVVFTLVASPTLAKIVSEKEGAVKRKVTGVVHVAPIDAQIKAMAAYRPFDTLGGLYTAAEQILVDQVPPSAIPIEPLKRFSYQIRMSAAEKLHLPPPLPMLGYAELISDAPVAQ